MTNPICLKPNQSYRGMEQANLCCLEEAPSSRQNEGESREFLKQLTQKPEARKSWRDTFFKATGIYIYKWGEGVVGTAGTVYGCGGSMPTGTPGTSTPPTTEESCFSQGHCNDNRDCCGIEVCKGGICLPPDKCFEDKHCDEGKECNTDLGICEKRTEKEVCDSIDNDGNGQTDEKEGSTPEQYLPLDRMTGGGLGECREVREICMNGKYVPLEQRVGEDDKGGGETLCDGLDNDCDGETDEDLGQTTCGTGKCEHTIDNCFMGAVQLCDPMEGASQEICDGFDNDCDGQTDEVTSVPISHMPQDQQILSPTRAYLAWRFPLPSNLTQIGYELCWTNDPSTFNNFSDTNSCPHRTAIPTDRQFHVLENLAENSTYRWKTRVICNSDNPGTSFFSPVSSFFTDNSLVAWWKFDEDLGNNSIVDSTGHIPNGTLGDPTRDLPGPSRITSMLGLGNALLFDSANWNTVVMPHHRDLEPSHLSLEAWIKPNKLTDCIHGWCGLVSKADSDEISSGYRWNLGEHSNDSRVTFRMAQGISDEDTVIRDRNLMDVGVWTYVGATYDGSVGRLYRNELAPN